MPILLLLSLIVFFAGFLLLLISGIWTIGLAFWTHWGWGLTSLFLPLAALIFIISNWSKPAVRRSFWVGLAGSLLMFLGAGAAIWLGDELDQQTARRDLILLERAVNRLASAEPDVQPAESASESDYQQFMSLGYLAYKKQDYQTAKLNFQNALEVRPADRIAAEALVNTERQLISQPKFEGR